MKPQSEINVTPLVDVVLVLLIIFMVVAPLMFHGYDVSVPTKGTSDAAEKYLMIQQTEAKIVVIDQQNIPLNELNDRLRQIFVAHSRKVIYSGADQLYYGDVAKTLDTIRNAGAEKIGIFPYEQK